MYYSDMISALSLTKTKMLDLYAWEAGKKKIKTTTTCGEIAEEVNVIGGHALMISNGTKIATKRMKMSTEAIETNEVTKVSIVLVLIFILLAASLLPPLTVGAWPPVTLTSLTISPLVVVVLIFFLLTSNAFKSIIFALVSERADIVSL